VRKHCLMTSAPTDLGRMREGVAVPFGQKFSTIRGSAADVHHPGSAPGPVSGSPSPGWGGLPDPDCPGDRDLLVRSFCEQARKESGSSSSRGESAGHPRPAVLRPRQRTVEHSGASPTPRGSHSAASHHRGLRGRARVFDHRTARPAAQRAPGIRGGTPRLDPGAAGDRRHNPKARRGARKR
jgi:hypothetical protein